MGFRQYSGMGEIRRGQWEFHADARIGISTLGFENEDGLNGPNALCIFLAASTKPNQTKTGIFLLCKV
jgi:hypothetical protein